MKKIISLLVVLAMLMALAPAVFATGTGTDMDPYVYEVIGEIPAYYDLEPGQVIYIQAPACGATVTLTNADMFAYIGAYNPRLGGVSPIASTNFAGTATVSAVLNEDYGFFGDPGDPVVFAVANENPYTATSVGLTVSFDDPNGSGPAGSVPNGGALALGDNNVTLTNARIPMMAAHWTYTAAEGGNLTVTVSSINGNSNLGMAFGMGNYALMVGETDGQWTNTATVYVNANDIVDIVVLDTMDMEDVPAVINLSFEAGEPPVVKDPADYFDQDPNGNYIIESLEDPVEIFTVNADINYIYTAESAGTVTVTPTVDGMTATNCWIELNNGGFDSSARPVTVVAGDVVIINIWDGYEGTVTLTAGGGNPGGGNPDGGNPGGGDPGGEPSNQPITGTASAEEDTKHVISYTATENGTLSITVGDGNAQWYSDVMDFSTFGIIADANGTAEDTYTCDVVAGTDYGIRFYGPGDPCAAISGIPYTIVFTPTGTPSGPQLEEFVEMTEEITEEGTYDLTVSTEAQTTLYTFKPTEAGTYKIELIGGNVTMSEWSAIMYQWTADAEDGVLTVAITDVGQNIFIGLSGEEDAQIKITKTGDASNEPEYDTIVYENQQTPVTFDDSKYEVEDNVNVDDDKIDTAVLGTDGYYHLNSADGPILYVDFFGTEPSIGAAWGYGQVSFAQYEDNELVSLTDYQEALGEYMMAQNNGGIFSYGNKYHPLTADLIEILQKVGENNGWYGEDGLVGDSEDAWMFSCVTMSAVEEKPEGGNAQTGDFGIIAAAVTMAISAIGGVAVVAKKKEF